MSSFNEPNGICFHFGDELPALAVSAAIRKITSFLQAVEPYVELQKYDDWWEHDGLHFHRGQLDFDALYAMINSPKQLLESTPEDDFVFVGVAPADNAWYLRYRVEWDESESELIGSCSVILPEHLANRFRAEVKPRLEEQPAEIDSETFYQKVKL